MFPTDGHVPLTTPSGMPERRIRPAPGPATARAQRLPAAAGHLVIAGIGRTATSRSAGIAAIPASAFHAGPDAPAQSMRFAHRRRDQALRVALARPRRYLRPAD